MEQKEEQSQNVNEKSSLPQKNQNLWSKFIPINRIIHLIFHAISVAVNTITSYVHIPEIAIGPIVGSLITATATLMIGLFTLSNIFSEQFLYRPLLLQDSSAQFNLTVEHYRQSIITNYLEKTTLLLIDHKNSEIQASSSLLRAITQETLQELDGKRKRYIILLLLDAKLLQNPLNSLLIGADLSNIDLQNLNLSHANLEQVNLTKANLEATNLDQANLHQADLSNANLMNADLRGAILTGIKIDKTIFTNACYDLQTQFSPNFDPKKQNMKQISTFSSCASSI